MSFSLKASLRKIEKTKKMTNNEWYSVRSMFGNTWAMFFIMIGARERGKSYAVMDRFLKDWKFRNKPFTWMRLKDTAQKKLLSNNASELIDPDLQRKYDLELTVKGHQVYDHGKKMCKVLCLSTFYNDKGVALYDNEYDLGYNIMLDEANLEEGERRQGDLAYQFVNQLENLVRSKKEKIRVCIVMNDTEKCGEILALFNFIPEEWGRYKVRKKRAVIDYIPNSEKYNERRKGTVADILMSEKSTFKNKRSIDKTLVYKGRLHHPTAIIMFNAETKFTLWDSKVIKTYNKEQCKTVIAMRPYLDKFFSTELRNTIFEVYDARGYLFRDLITYMKFSKSLELLKPRKN